MISLIFLPENQQCAKSALMPFTLQKHLYDIKRAVLICLRHLTDIRHNDSDESVTFAVLPFPGLEKPRQHNLLLLVLAGSQIPDDLRVHRHCLHHLRRQMTIPFRILNEVLLMIFFSTVEALQRSPLDSQW